MQKTSTREFYDDCHAINAAKWSLSTLFASYSRISTFESISRTSVNLLVSLFFLPSKNFCSNNRIFYSHCTPRTSWKWYWFHNLLILSWNLTKLVAAEIFEWVNLQKFWKLRKYVAISFKIRNSTVKYLNQKGQEDRFSFAAEDWYFLLPKNVNPQGTPYGKSTKYWWLPKVILPQLLI